MKNGFAKMIFAVMLLLWAGIASAQDIAIDVAKTTTSGSKAGETDFTKSFKLILKSTKANPNLDINITNDEGVPERIQKGVRKGNNTIVFGSVQGRGFAVAKQGGGDLSLSPASDIQVFVGDKSFLIGNKQAATDEAGTVVNTFKTSTQSNSIVGIELHDALLAKTYLLNEDDNLLELLGKIKGLDEPVDLAVVKTAYKNNPFILPLIETAQLKSTRGGNIQGGFSGLLNKALNTDVTTVADGIARFLVRRTKEELTVAFFQHFKDLLNKPEYRDAQILFSETMQTLNAIDEKIYLFENYINALRESFEKDLSLLLKNMPVVIKEGRFSQYFNERQSLKHSLLLSLFAADELTNGTHPGKVIENLPDEDVDSLTDKNAVGSIHTVQLVSASLKSRGSDSYWTTLDSIQMLLTREDDRLVAAKFYLGFLYEKSAHIQFQNGTLQSFLSAIAGSLPDIEKYIVFVKSLGRKCHDVEANIKQIKLKQPETPSIDLYHRLFHSFADVVEHINSVGELPGINTNAAITAAVKKYLGIFRECNDLALNVVQKKYGSAIVNAYSIYLEATEKKDDATSSAVKRNKSLLIDGDTDSDSTAMADRANLSAAKTSEFILKYGNFMANIVNANNSEEVAQAIETAALPVGSATIKRHSDWNVSLNAYVGLFLGSEKIRGVDTGFRANLYGVTAPIGIAISKGVNWQKRSGWSYSLFFSILDLGAPVAFRFKDDKTDKVPSIQLKDIVSPGILASIGFPSLPISWNLGWQSGPTLRKINAQLADKASSTYNRWSTSLVVDIPIFNFFTKRNHE